MALPGWMKLCLLSALAIVLGIAIPLVFRERSIGPDQLSLGCSASRIKCRKGFTFQPNGHGGPKTQYSAKNADKNGGYYFLECERGKVTSIYVTYSKPVSREVSIETVKRLVGDSKIAETDSRELASDFKSGNGTFLEASEKDDVQMPSEYFYFSNGNYAELQYEQPGTKRISRIIGYLGSNQTN